MSKPDKFTATDPREIVFDKTDEKTAKQEADKERKRLQDLVKGLDQEDENEKR